MIYDRRLSVNRFHIQPRSYLAAFLLMSSVFMTLLPTLKASADIPNPNQNITAYVNIDVPTLSANASLGVVQGTVTVKNTSKNYLVGVKLFVSEVTPANVALYNSDGAPGTTPFVELPLTSGILTPGQSSSVLVQLLNYGQSVQSVNFTATGSFFSTANSATLDVSGVDLGNAPLHPGSFVYVDNVPRGTLDASGHLEVLVEANIWHNVTVYDEAQSVGMIDVPPVMAGKVASVTVNAGESDDDFAFVGTPRVDQVQLGVLPSTSSAVTIRTLKNQVPVPYVALNQITATDANSRQVDLTSLFSVVKSGSAIGTISANGPAFTKAIASLSGKVTLDVNANPFPGSLAFWVGNYHVEVLLEAPTGIQDFPLGNILVHADFLDADVHYQATSCSNGTVQFPVFPAGNVAVSASTTYKGINYQLTPNAYYVITESATLDAPFIPASSATNASKQRRRLYNDGRVQPGDGAGKTSINWTSPNSFSKSVTHPQVP